MAGGADSPDARAALESLFRNYWRPLYIYARRRGHTHHNAEDLVQAFFHRMLEKEALAQASRQRGRFRYFLLASLQNFTANERDRLSTLKRGGAQAHFSLDEADGEKLVLEADAPDQSAEKQFDRAWARAIFHQAMIQFEEEFTAEGKQSQFHDLTPRSKYHAQLREARGKVDWMLQKQGARSAPRNWRDCRQNSGMSST